MRVSPLISLGLTNLGLLSWFWYGANALNASAYEAEEPSSESSKGYLNSSQASDRADESQPLALNRLVDTKAEPAFSPYVSTQLDKAVEKLAPALPEQLPSATFSSQAIAQRIPANLDSAQVARVVSETFNPVSSPEIDRIRIKAVVAKSFGRSPSITIPTPTPSFSLPSAPSMVALVPDNLAVATEAFYSHSLQASDSSGSLQVAQFVELEPAVITSPAVSPSTVPSAGRNLPVLASPSSPANVSVPSTPAPASPSPTFSPLSTGVDENYILGPGDIIDVSFFNVPEYSGQHRVSTSGTIDLPLIGRTSVRGLTLNQAGLAIANSYRSQLQSPIVSVNVVQQRPVQVAISGEITQPGLYTVVAQGSDYPRLFQALQQAGGLTQAANLSEVEVRRKDVAGRETTVKVNLLALIKDGDINQNVFLQDGDSIVIPSSTTLDTTALSQLSGSNLRSNSDRPINVAIVGEVTQPGPYQLAGGSQSTVVQALQTAGGITPSANLKEVQLRRQTRQGGQQVFNIDLWELLQTGDISQDLALQQGDTLTVPTASELSVEEATSLAASTLSPETISVNIIGEVQSPGTLAVKSNTSFNEALLASGGFNRRARQEATLIRFNANGTVDRQFIDVDLSDDLNSETNPLLRPNDVIVVGRSAKAAFDDSVSSFSNTFNLVWPFLLLF